MTCKPQLCSCGRRVSCGLCHKVCSDWSAASRVQCAQDLAAGAASSNCNSNCNWQQAHAAQNKQQETMHTGRKPLSCAHFTIQLTVLLPSSQFPCHYLQPHVLEGAPTARNTSAKLTVYMRIKLN